ncbi:45376_t:CDS:2, partial [Gigaspora margarita]
YQAIRSGARSCIDLLKKEYKQTQIIDQEISDAVQTITAKEVYIIRQLVKNYPKIMEKQLKLIKEDKRQTNKQKRKALLLEAESSVIDYGIEEMEEQRKTQTEQISINTEFYKENPLKVLMELDLIKLPQEKSTDSISENQNLYQSSKIYKRRRKEDKESSMKVDTNTVQSEIRLEKKFVLRDGNIISKGKNLSQLKFSLNNSKGKAQILDILVIIGSDHKIAIVGIKTEYLKPTLSTANTRRKGYQQTIYLYDRASEEDWDGYANDLDSYLTKRNLIDLLEKINLKELINQNLLDHIWNIGKRKQRQKVFVYHSVVEISKIIREISKYKANVEQENSIKWNKPILSISIALNIKINQWERQDLSD